MDGVVVQPLDFGAEVGDGDVAWGHQLSAVLQKFVDGKINIFLICLISLNPSFMRMEDTFWGFKMVILPIVRPP